MAAVEFAPARFLGRSNDHQGETPQQQRPALLILNRPIASLDVLERLWAHTGFRLCADGGANRLHDMFDGLDDAEARRQEFLPSMIHGDLDSLRDDVRAYYADRGVAVTRDVENYSIDFNKAIMAITAAVSPPDPAAGGSWREILVLSTLTGRVDSALRTLFEMVQVEIAHPDTRLWLFSESSVSFILRPGVNRIVVPVVRGEEEGGSAAAAGYFTRNIGIMPSFGPAVISTTGLESNVTDWLISVDSNHITSYHAKDEVVTVKTDARVLFTIERVAALP